MLDIKRETLITIGQASKIANPSRPPHISTVWRWLNSGVRGGVRLESVIVGGRRFTSREAVSRFLSTLNDSGEAPQTPTDSAKAACARLEEAGV